MFKHSWYTKYYVFIQVFVIIDSFVAFSGPSLQTGATL
jgi:hypothetical protein